MKYVKMFESWLNEAEGASEIQPSQISKMTIGQFKELDQPTKARIITIMQKSLFPGLSPKYLKSPNFDSRNKSDRKIFATDIHTAVVDLTALDEKNAKTLLLDLKLKELDSSDEYTLGQMAEVFKTIVIESKRYTPDEFFEINVSSGEAKAAATVWTTSAKSHKPIDSETQGKLAESVEKYLDSNTEGKKYLTQVRASYDGSFAPKKPAGKTPAE